MAGNFFQTVLIHNPFTTLLLRSQDPIYIGHGLRFLLEYIQWGMSRQIKREKVAKVGNENQSSDWYITADACEHTHAHTHTHRHIHAYLVLPACYQPRKGVFPLPEEIRVAPKICGMDWII